MKRKIRDTRKHFPYLTFAVFTLAGILSLGYLNGCGQVSREVAKFTGFSRECIDGVEYLQFASGVTVAYNPDGTIKQCKKK